MKYIFFSFLLIHSTTIYSQNGSRTVCQISYVTLSSFYNATPDTILCVVTPKKGYEMFALDNDSLLIAPNDSVEIVSMEWAETYKPAVSMFNFNLPNGHNAVNHINNWVYKKPSKYRMEYVFTFK